jgi:EmrB/QacA subfamily drug resistance transporter
VSVLTEPVRMGTGRGRWVLLATIAGSSVAQLDGTVVNVALAAIGAEFDAGFTALQWIINAYTLTLAALILLGGVLGDLYGRRRIFLLGVVWFALASALCALSPSEGVLIAARALQGVGGALLTPGSLAIISATFAAEDRATAIGAWSGLGGIAGAVGPFVGGWLVAVDWRLVFLINLPVAALIVAVTVRHVPESRDDEVVLDGARRVDVGGTVLVVAALAGLTYALTEAGRTGWHLGLVLVGVAGLLAGAAFVLLERRTAHPLVRLDMFGDRTFVATNVATVFIYAALSVYFFLLVLQLQVVSGWSALAAGTSILPVTACMLLLSARAGALAQQMGPRVLMTVGSLLGAAGFLAALRVGPDADYLTDVLPSVLLLGLGLACAVAPLTAAVLAAAPAHLAGAASGINNATARSAGLLAIAVVPALAGLGGAGTGDAATLGRGFVVAMLIGAGLLAAGAAVSWFGLGRRGGRPLA